MITILHGDHIDASRLELQKMKQEKAGLEIRQLNGKSLDPALLTQAISSSSLFDIHTLVVIEQLMSTANKKNKAFDQYANIISTASQTCDIVLWEDKEITSTILKSFGTQTNVRLFKLPVLIFQFLDALRPNNAPFLLETFEKLISLEPAELIFSMMVSRVRQLIQISDGVTPLTLKDWQRTRLTTQTNSFSMKKLVDNYSRLLDIEYSIKSGNSPFSLAEHIEQFIIQL
jgi:hypothetical protein